MNFYSNGKLLLTGEYVVLDGAKALAIPTKYGQDLIVDEVAEPSLLWESFTFKDECWFQAEFDLPKLRLKSATFFSEKEGSAEFIAETLLDILQEARNLNPHFLNNDNGCHVQTKLSFPREWGLGTSSTLINSIASWARVDAFQLLWNSFKGSGYDIACAQNNSPIFYQISKDQPLVQLIDFNPSFCENLYFVHLNQKQDSKAGIKKYRENKTDLSDQIHQISEISEALSKAETLESFENFIEVHEQIISKIIHQPTVKVQLFSDYFGKIKSLGAWGGDFILVTGNEHTPAYFKSKGYSTILPYKAMVL